VGFKSIRTARGLPSVMRVHDVMLRRGPAGPGGLRLGCRTEADGSRFNLFMPWFVVGLGSICFHHTDVCIPCLDYKAKRARIADSVEQFWMLDRMVFEFECEVGVGLYPHAEFVIVVSSS